MARRMHHVISAGTLLGLLTGGVIVPAAAAAEEPPTYVEVAEQVADVRAGGGSSPAYLTAMGDDLYFSAYGDATGRELWRSDGTEAGTQPVMDINPGSGDGGVEEIVTAGGSLFFAATDGAHGWELWTSDGTSAGTRMVSDIMPGSDGSYPKSITAVGDVVLFSAMDVEHGDELWRSDGTAEGTWLVKDIRPESYEATWPEPHLVALSSEPVQLTVLGDTVYFEATTEDFAAELWRTDGTPDGTQMVADIAEGGDTPSIFELTPVGGDLFFAAETAAAGRELWRVDGTTGQPHLVKDIAPGPLQTNGQGSGSPDALVDVGGMLLFTADDGIHGRELWRSDGTDAGTTMVRDLVPGTGSGLDGEQPPAVLDGVLVFPGRSTDHGTELWASDGSTDGTRLLGDILTGPGSSWPRELAVWQDTVYFQAGDGYAGAELWRTDGSQDGTVMVQDLFPGTDLNGFPNEGRPQHLTPVGDTLYFSAESPDGRELWTLRRQPVVVDDVAPETSLDEGPSSVITQSTATFSFSADEAGSTFECRLDGGSWAPCESPRQVTGLSEGEHVFEVRATDAAGNVDLTPAARTFSVDTSAPETILTGGPSGTVEVTSVQFSFSAGEAGSTFECRLDGGSWAPCESPRQVTGLSEGEHVFEVRATDAAGNVDLTPAARTFAVSVPQTGPTPECLTAQAELEQVIDKLSAAKTSLIAKKKALKRAKADGASKKKITRLKNKVARLKNKVARLKKQRDEMRDTVAALCG